MPVDLGKARELAEMMAQKDVGWAVWPIMRHPQCGEAGRQMLALIDELQTARAMLADAVAEVRHLQEAGLAFKDAFVDATNGPIARVWVDGRVQPAYLGEPAAEKWRALQHALGRTSESDPEGH